jgi:hypothetical protein
LGSGVFLPGPLCTDESTAWAACWLPAWCHACILRVGMFFSFFFCFFFPCRWSFVFFAAAWAERRSRHHVGAVYCASLDGRALVRRVAVLSSSLYVHVVSRSCPIRPGPALIRPSGPPLPATPTPCSPPAKSGVRTACNPGLELLCVLCCVLGFGFNLGIVLHLVVVFMLFFPL